MDYPEDLRPALTVNQRKRRMTPSRQRRRPHDAEAPARHAGRKPERGKFCNFSRNK